MFSSYVNPVLPITVSVTVMWGRVSLSRFSWGYIYSDSVVWFWCSCLTPAFVATLWEWWLSPWFQRFVKLLLRTDVWIALTQSVVADSLSLSHYTFKHTITIIINPAESLETLNAKGRNKLTARIAAWVQSFKIRVIKLIVSRCKSSFIRNDLRRDANCGDLLLLSFWG
jgi:hypothetical protein